MLGLIAEEIVKPIFTELRGFKWMYATMLAPIKSLKRKAGRR